MAQKGTTGEFMKGFVGVEENLELGSLLYEEPVELLKVWGQTWIYSERAQDGRGGWSG